MKDLLIDFLVDNFDIYFSDYSTLYTQEKNDKFVAVFYAFQNYYKKLKLDDIAYYVDLDYYTDKGENIVKTVRIYTENILVYLYTK